ncbi:MAG TPA: CopG family transcriptional regulator, partial [Thermoanaerobacterales bacterium]|nr:CopG family transcriptional regulator [Thermoanaerobacterales bacterium]
DAMKLYIKEMEKLRVREQLKIGYMQMAEVNIKFAEMGIYEDYKDFVLYETRLSECE